MDTVDQQQTIKDELSVHTKPKRVDVELMGRMDGSGFKDPPYLVRRADGQVIQLPHPLYAVVEAADGTRSLDEIASRVTEEIKQGIDADGVGMLIDKKLRPLGLFPAADGSAPQVERVDPMLALKFKKGVIPAGAVRAITLVFRPFFFGPVVVAAVATLVVFDLWLFGSHGVAQSVRQTIYQPGYLIVLFGLIVLAAAFHEAGHATACAYGGAAPGEMGVGLYVVWPAFYTDVTDSYRLGRGGRLRTDLGGVYFNGLFILALGGLYFLTRQEFLLLVVLVQHFAILQQLLPFLRLDGYYIVADLTGVPDMFSRIGPTLASFLPWRETDERVKELTWWARAIVALWVLTIVPLMVYVLGLVVFHLPRIIATAWDSWNQLWDRSQGSFAAGDTLAGVSAIAQMAVLALPALAATLTSTRVAHRSVTGGWKATRERPVLRAAYLTGVLGAAALIAYVWWPNDDYVPIQPYERWTAQETVASFSGVTTGDPGLQTQQRARTTSPDTSGSTSDPSGSTSVTGGTTSDPGGSTSDPAPAQDPGDPAPVPPGDEPRSEPSDSPEPSPSPTESAEPTPSAEPAPSTQAT